MKTRRRTVIFAVTMRDVEDGVNLQQLGSAVRAALSELAVTVTVRVASLTEHTVYDAGPPAPRRSGQEAGP